jgi:hypothetical protein
MLLVLTGGFEISLGGVSFRSHEIDRFIMLAAVAGLADLLGDERCLPLVNRLRTLSQAATRILPHLLRLSAVVAAMAAGLWLVARFVRAMSAETPVGDMALLELYTISATANNLLLGPYSRFGWHHPGPTMFYLFRPLYELSGHRFESLRWSSLVFNVASLTAILALVRRRASPALTLAVVAGLGLYVVRVPDALASPWNPHLLVLPLALLLAASAAVVDGEPRGWPLVAALASFLIQTHLSVAPTVGAIVIATIVWVVAQDPDPRVARGHWFWANVSGWVLAAMWILPLAEQMTAREGNLTAIYRSFFQQPLDAPSLRDAFAACLNILSAPLLPHFTVAWGAHTVPTVGVVGLVVSLGPLVAVPWTVRHLNEGRDRFGSALAILCLVASLAALWSVSRIQGEILDQLIFWISMIGILNLACLAAAGVPFVAERVGRGYSSRYTFVPAVVVWLVVAGATVEGTRHLYRSHALAIAEPIFPPRIRSATEAVSRYLAHEGLRRPLVRLNQLTWGYAAGVALALAKSDTPVSVEPGWVFMFGSQYAPVGNEDCEVIFADGDRRGAVNEGRYTVVAEWPEVSVQVARLVPTRR